MAAEFDGNPQIEFIDTFMYGFWGEGHTWPFGNNPFPDYLTAERTWTNMLEVQLEHFSKTPLLTNTQPDLQSGWQFRTARPHGPQQQLDSQRHHLY